MYPYFLLVGIPLALGAVGFKCRNKNKERLIMIVFFALYFLLLALRSEQIGIDLSNYQYYYDKFGQESWKAVLTDPKDVEVGYALLCKLVYVTGASFHTFLIVIAVIEVLPLAILYLCEAENAVLSIALFLVVGIFPIPFSALRQSIAISLGAIAYLLLKKKKYIPYLLIVLLATTFHMSALMLLFMLPLYHLKITKKWLIFIVPVILTVFLFNEQILSFIINLLPERYQAYQVEKTGAFLMLVLYCLFAIYVFVVTNDFEIENETMVLRNFLLFSILLQTFSPVQTVAMRMNYYYILFIPLFLPKAMKYTNLRFEKLNKVAEAVMIVFFVFYFFYNAYTGEDILQIYPYEFYRWI